MEIGADTVAQLMTTSRKLEMTRKKQMSITKEEIVFYLQNPGLLILAPTGVLPLI